MKTTLVAALAIGLASASPAWAHFRLDQPADWLQTNAVGDPTGGDQKTSPCGVGTPSGLATQVRAGSTLHIKLTETIPHGGHYRIAIAPNTTPASFALADPAVTLNAGDCQSAAIQSPVVAPVLADGLFPHTQAQATANKVWETDVTVPAELGSATLQIVEFMTPHAPPCFYYHCAALEIVAPDAGVDDGGVIVVEPPGTVDAGSSDSGGVASGATPDGSPSVADASGVIGGAQRLQPIDASAGSGCAVGGNAAPLAVTVAALAIALGARRRRRSS